MSLRDNRVILICMIAAILAIFSVAKAEESAVSAPPPPSANGSNSLEANTDNFLSHMHASFFANFHGPALNHLGAAETVDQNGKLSKSPMYLDSEAAAVYMFDKNLGVGAVLPFFLYARGEPTQLGDVGVKVVSKKTVSTSDLNLATNLIVQFSSSDYSKARGQDIALKTTPSIRYILHGTRYSIGAWTEAKAYLGVTSGKAFKLWAAPYVNYQLSPNVSLNLQYELEADHFANKGITTHFDMYQNDLVPSVVFMVTPSIMINPYLQIFTGDTVSSERMALGALLSASL